MVVTALLFGVGYHLQWAFGYLPSGAVLRTGTATELSCHRSPAHLFLALRCSGEVTWQDPDEWDESLRGWLERDHRTIIVTRVPIEGTAEVHSQLRQGRSARSGSGLEVAVVRDFIWDAIALLLAQAIKAGIAALAAAIPSFGSSLAVFAGWYTTQVASVCLKIANWIEALLKRARKVFKRFTALRKLIDKAIDNVQDFAKAMRRMQRYAGRPMATDPGHLTRSRRNNEVPYGTMPGDLAARNKNWGDPIRGLLFDDPTPSTWRDIPAHAKPDGMDIGTEIGDGEHRGRSTVPDITDI